MQVFEMEAARSLEENREVIGDSTWYHKVAIRQPYLPVQTVFCNDDEDDDEGRINFSVALSPKTTRTRNNKPKQ